MTLVSKFNSTCKACGGAILVGDTIDWSKSIGARHATVAQCNAAKMKRAAAQQTQQPLVDRPTIDLKPIVKFLQDAQDRGLKSPKLRILAPNTPTEIRLSLTRTGAAPGTLAINAGPTSFLGCVRPNGDMIGLVALDIVLQKHLLRVALDPAGAAKEYAALMSRCSFCGLSLTDAGSVQHGYGPVCAKHWNLPWTSFGVPILTPVPQEEAR